MQCTPPQRSEGPILLLDVQGSQEKGLHPAPLGAAQHPPGRSHESFSTEPSLACSMPTPLAPLPRQGDWELPGAPRRQGTRSGGDIWGCHPSAWRVPRPCASPLRRQRECRDLSEADTGNGTHRPGTHRPGSQPRPAPRHRGMHGASPRGTPGSWERTDLAVPAPPCLHGRAPARSTAGRYRPPAKEVPKITRWPQLLLFPRQVAVLTSAPHVSLRPGRGSHPRDPPEQGEGLAPGSARCPSPPGWHRAPLRGTLRLLGGCGGGLRLRLGSLMRAGVSFYLQRQTIDHFKQP